MAEFREDEWISAVTGVGVIGRDKRLSTSFCGVRVREQTAEELWRASAMGARIVEAPIREMFRPGWEFCVSNHEDGYSEGETDEEPAQRAAGAYGSEPRTDSAYARWKKKRARRMRRDAFPPQNGSATPQNGSATPPNGAPAIPAAPKNPLPVKEQDEGAQAAVEGLEAYLEDLGAWGALKRAKEYARGIGGGAIIVGIEDGQDWTQPVDETRIKSVAFLTVLAKGQIYAKSYYNDPRNKNYGKVEIWTVAASSLTGPVQSTAAIYSQFDIHESRVIPFDGIVVSERHRSQERGFGDSIFTRVLPVLRDHEVSWSNTGVMISDFGQGVYKMDGLAQMLASKRADLAKARMEALDFARSTVRAVVLDPKDDFQRQQTPVTGLAELLDRFMIRLASAADMPVMLLSGDLPGGLNANGDTGLRMFQDRCEGDWCADVKPAIERLAKLAFLAKDGPTAGGEPPNWYVKLKPFRTESQGEQADTRLKVAQADKIYYDMGSLSAEEIAGSRFGGTDYSTETHLDHEARDGAAVQKEEDDAAREEAAKLTLKNPPEPAAPEPRADMLEQRDGEWLVLSKDGKKVLGRHKTRAEAAAQLAAIEAAKASR